MLPKLFWLGAYDNRSRLPDAPLWLLIAYTLVYFQPIVLVPSQASRRYLRQLRHFVGAALDRGS